MTGRHADQRIAGVGLFGPGQKFAVRVAIDNLDQPHAGAGVGDRIGAAGRTLDDAFGFQRAEDTLEADPLIAFQLEQPRNLAFAEIAFAAPYGA